LAIYNLSVSFIRNIQTTLEMIKWEHSIFALPFALSGAMLAAGGWPTRWQLLWIVVCMVSARSAAMAFNRIADVDIDAANPRTKMRALPAGTLSRPFVVFFTALFCGLFVLGAAELNRLTLYLSPVALTVVLLYSYTKRFTRWSHLVLGFALGIAPAAAWIAVRGSLDARILLLTVAVTCWVAGFDVLYACQDLEFDRQTGLHSIPQTFGIGGALIFSRTLHVIALLMMGALVYSFGLGMIAIAGVAVVGLLLAYEQSLVHANDLSKLNAAFFTMNGVIAVVFFIFVSADILMRR
jgi:4-hydroxybenzoate polyprenyltransferase